MSDVINQELSGPAARGTRLKQLRALTATPTHRQMSRAAIERKYGVSSSTLRHWEEGYGAGLTDDGARQVVDVYQQEGIHCSLGWLLTGKGQPPARKATTAINHEVAKTSDPLESIDKESEFFKSLHAEATIFTVKDDAMTPDYLPGDRVGGIRHYRQSIPSLIGNDCIVETKTGEIWFRRLQKSTIRDRYNLAPKNFDSKIERPFLYDVEIIICTPVIRIWRGKKWPA